MGSARRGDSQPMSAPASVSLPLRLPGPEPRGHSPSRLRPPPPRTLRADDAAPPQPMAFGNLSPAARPPRFKSASLSLSELEWGGPGGDLGFGGEGFGGTPPRCAPGPSTTWGATLPGGSTRGHLEALAFRSSDQTPMTPAARPWAQDRREMGARGAVWIPDSFPDTLETGGAGDLAWGGV